MKKPLSVIAQQAIEVRDKYTFEVLEAEYGEWTGDGASATSARAAIRGAIDRLKAAYDAYDTRAKG